MKKKNMKKLQEGFDVYLNDMSKGIIFDQEAKQRTKGRLFKMIDAAESSKNFSKKHRRKEIFSVKIFFSRAFVGALILVVFVSTTSVGIKRADASRPGDTLFVVDKLMEDVQLVFVRNPEKKIEIKTRVAAERLKELSELTDQLSLEVNTVGISDSSAAGTAEEPLYAVETENESVPKADSDEVMENVFLAEDGDTAEERSAQELPKVAASSSPIPQIEELSIQMLQANKRVAISQRLESALKEAMSEVNGAFGNLKKDLDKFHNQNDSDSVFYGQLNALDFRQEILLKKIEDQVSNVSLQERIRRTKSRFSEPKTEKKNIVVCHANKILSVSQSQLSFHLLHGDYEGECRKEEEQGKKDEGAVDEAVQASEAMIPAFVTENSENTPGENQEASKEGAAEIKEVNILEGIKEDDKILEDDLQEEHNNEQEKMQQEAEKKDNQTRELRGRVHLKGVIEEAGENYIVVLSEKISVSKATGQGFLLRNNLIGFQVGTWVEVDGVKTTTGEIIATKIRSK